MVAARHWRGGGLARHLAGMRSSLPTPDERLLARYADARDPADLEELVRRYRPLARSLARRFRSAGMASEDLEQAACLGLVNALLRFDPARGYAFSTFAVPTILGELRRLCRAAAWQAHVPRPARERLRDVRAASAALGAATGRAPSAAEIAAQLRWSEEQVVESLCAVGALESVPLDGDAVGAIDPGYELVELRGAIEAALPRLDDDQRRVLRLRYADERTFREIGTELALGPAQAARLLRSSVDRLAALAA
jgi:RNA polymerase sigma-B factor